MNSAEFNEKYKAYIEQGFEDRGLEIDIPEVTEYLDKVFQDFIKVEGFQFSMIKSKFGFCRFYAEPFSIPTSEVEKEVNKYMQHGK
jgi:hypothetical protein